jgi:RNA polymerase sigma-70 factor, ECF subfamily
MDQAAQLPSGACERGDDAQTQGSEDGTLVRQALAGDLQACGFLYDRYIRFVHVMCYDTVGNLDQSQDLTQEVFFRAFRDLDRLGRPEQFGAWLRGISHRVCRDWIRRRARERRRNRESAPIDVLQADHQDDDRLERLRIAIAGLPEKERAALHLFYLDEQSAEQARTVLGLSRSGFYRMLDRARDRLRRLLGGD